MDPFAALDFPKGKIAFVGAVRCDDIGVDEFRVELQNRPALYGAWRPKFSENGSDFEVEIVSFGYASKYNVANPDQKARTHLTAEEISTVEELVRGLFENKDIRERFSPFSMNIARFLGGINFLPGWILESNA